MTSQTDRKIQDIVNNILQKTILKGIEAENLSFYAFFY